MTPVDQEFVVEWNPDGTRKTFGDCQRAVIASLLDLPREQVPHFLQEAKGNGSIFWNLIDQFLASKGWSRIVMPLPLFWEKCTFNFEQSPLYHELIGPSPRGNGLYHAVVGKNSAIYFDPHPSRAGLIGPPDLWKIAFYVKAS